MAENMANEKARSQEETYLIHSIGYGLKLQPCPAGYLHLRPQPQGSVQLNFFDPPEIHRIPWPDLLWMTTPSAEAHTAHYPIY